MTPRTEESFCKWVGPPA